MKYLNYTASKKKQKRFDPEQRLLHPMETERENNLFIFDAKRRFILVSVCCQGKAPVPCSCSRDLFCFVLFDRDVMQTEQN